MKKLVNKKVLGILLAVVMLLAMSVPAFALYDNLVPYETPYNDESEPGDYRIFMVRPPASYFTESAAENVQWSVIGDDFEAIIVDTYAMESLDGLGYVACAEVMVDEDAGIGSVSIEAKAITYKPVDMSIYIDGTRASATGITSEYYDINGNPLGYDSNMTVYATDYYNSPSYVSAIDAIYRSWFNNLNTTGNRLINYSIGYDSNLHSFYVGSLSFNYNGNVVTYSTQYTSTGDYGWEYRIVRNGNILPVSEVTYPDFTLLQNGDRLIWAYGLIGEIDFDSLV